MVFDLGDFDRLGEIGDIVIQNNIDVVNIDHHIPRDNSMYALSIVNQKSPSTTYMLWKYFGEMGLSDKPLTDEIAVALYAGLVNDTGSFRYNAVTSDTHIMASHMLESKVNPNAVFTHIYENRSISKIHLFSEMINNIEFLDNNKVAYVVINDSIFNKTKSSIEDAEGFSEFIRAIDGVEIAFSAIQKNKNYKISFRSSGLYTINDIAALFGGGGHHFAGGCF